ncbi:putative polysaccharide biosynthesis protein [Dethiothermospora halolimnae]|uniref:putative polysaccharide biosynthesis protein n=1 Tax=Dethiothermospora halolimnae TaxID=3114390 RepID=UPI003CCC0C3F
MTKKNFLQGAAILGMAGLIIKIIGAVYRIPLSNLINDTGMGYFQAGYSFYALLIMISTTGLTTSLAKLVSEKRSIGDYRNANKIFKVAFIGFLIGGIITSTFMFFGAKYISETIENTNAYYALIALVPALFFVPIMSAFRGYLQGTQTMTPTAISQLVEQLFRVIVGFYLAYTLLDRGLPMAAGGASFGASAGAIAGTLVIFIMYLSKRKEFKKELKNSGNYKEESTSVIIKRIINITVPIMIGSAIVPVMNSIDAWLIPGRLQLIGFDEKAAVKLYGQLSGMAQTLINFPQVFSMALVMSLVPAISDAFSLKNYKKIEKMTRSGVRVTLLIGLPAAFGMFILARPIMNLLYSSQGKATIDSLGQTLEVLAFSVIFLTLVQSLTAIMQGMGKPIIPVRNLAIGALFKVILTYTLTGIEGIGIRGAAFSTVIAYLIATILNFISVKKYTKTYFNIKSVFIKPLISTVIMTLVVWITFNFINPMLGSKLSTVISITIGAIIYGLALLLTGTITERDFSLLPKGDKIARLLKSIKLLRS